MNEKQIVAALCFKFEFNVEEATYISHKNGFNYWKMVCLFKLTSLLTVLIEVSQLSKLDYLATKINIPIFNSNIRIFNQ